MWRIFNFLFGWQYVEYRDSCTTFVAKVIVCPNGRLRMVTLMRIYDALLNEDGTFEDTGGRWVALTWTKEALSQLEEGV